MLWRIDQVTQLIKRGGFREQAARQLKYKNSVNQRTDINAHVTYQPVNEATKTKQDALEPCRTSHDGSVAINATATTLTSSDDSAPKNN